MADEEQLTDKNEIELDDATVQDADDATTPEFNDDLVEDEATEAQPDAAVAEESIEEAVVEEPAEEVDPYKEFKRELRLRPGKWYVIHTYAGFERKVRDNLGQRIENKKRSENSEGADDIYEVQVPMEDVVEVKNGQRKLVTRVRIPGYVLVRMHLTEDSWSLVRQTPGVTGFVGNAHDPVPLRFKEVFEILKSTVELPDESDLNTAKKGGAQGRQPAIEVEYEVGETITIKEGSFEGLTGSVSEVHPVAGRINVLVSLFGRETPVDLTFDQVSKL